MQHSRKQKMNKSGFMVYWFRNENRASCWEHFEMDNMKGALDLMEVLRKKPDAFQFITMVSQNPDSVGKAGVSDILPEDYSWNKQDRAGRERKREKSIMGDPSNE